MARVIDLDKVVPQDLDFKYRGESYVIPGDIKGPDAFKLVRVYEEAMAANEGTLDEREAANQKVEEALLALLQVSQPDLEEFPFGQLAGAAVLAEILVLLGFTIIEIPPEPSPKK